MTFSIFFNNCLKISYSKVEESATFVYFFMTYNARQDISTVFPVELKF